MKLIIESDTIKIHTDNKNVTISVPIDGMWASQTFNKEFLIKKLTE